MNSYIEYIVNLFTFLAGILMALLNVNKKIKASEKNRISNDINAFLREAYLDVENYANRGNPTDDDKRGFERAIAKIQLLGTQQQAEEARKVIEQLESGGGSSVDSLLHLLGKDLRKGLDLSEYEIPKYMRLK